MSGGRTIPVIADDYVDMEFGTGALKITPGAAGIGIWVRRDITAAHDTTCSLTCRLLH
jgi:valyl-tRNA synthetase